MSKQNFTFTIAIIGLSMLVFSQCSDNSNNPAAPSNTKTDPSLANDIQPIFNTNCAVSGCHNVANAAQLNLTAGQSRGNLVEVNATQDATKKRVKTSDAATSYLVIKIEGRQTIGSKMPTGGSLSADQIQSIKNWINQGAKNN